MLASGIFYHQYVKRLDTDIRERLVNGVTLAAELVDMNMLFSLNSPDSPETGFYKSARSTLEKIRLVQQFRRIYILRNESGKWYYILSAGGQAEPFLSEDTSPHDVIIEALSEGVLKIPDKPLTDETGSFYPVFLPVKTDSAELVVCADFDIGDFTRRKSRAGMLFWGIVLGILVVASLLIFYLREIILKPILGIMKDISLSAREKDFTFRIGVRSQDEIGRLAGNFNTFLETSGGFFRELQGLTETLASASGQLASVSSGFTRTTQNQAEDSGKVIESIESISTLINSIARLSREQLDIFVSQRKLIGELYEGINHVSTQADNGLSLSETVAARARNGEVSLSGINKSMAKLMESSNDMIKIIEIINDISDRINLLSLNASIEAARAGEAGRGFAVVAEEISKLADQTASSTKNIDSLIKANSEEITREIDNINQTTKILTEIIEGVNEMKSEVSRIQVSTREQLSMAETVRNNAGNIFKRAEEINTTADSQKSRVDEIGLSVSEMGNLNKSVVSGADEIASSSEGIASLAAGLREKISRFKF